MPDALEKQILDVTVTTITDLALSGVESGLVRARKMPFNDGFIHTGITVSWGTPRNSPDWPTNERDLIGRPVLITEVEGTARGSTDRLAEISLRRQTIFRAFNNKRPTITGDTDVNLVICKASYGDPVLPERYRDSYDAWQIIVHWWFLEPRS